MCHRLLVINVIKIMTIVIPGLEAGHTKKVPMRALFLYLSFDYSALLFDLHGFQVIVDRPVPYDLFHLNVGPALQNRVDRDPHLFERIVISSESRPRNSFLHGTLQDIHIESGSGALRDALECLGRLCHLGKHRDSRRVFKDLELHLPI